MLGFLLYLLTVVAVPLAYLAGRIRSWVGRIAGFLGTLFLPLAIYTCLFLSAQPVPEGFVAWWMAGLVMLGPLLGLWCLFAIWGFVVGARDGRSRP